MIIGIVGCGGIARAHVRALCLNPLVTGLALYDVNADNGVRLENGNFPTLSVLSLTSDFVPLSANP